VHRWLLLLLLLLVVLYGDAARERPVRD